MGAASILESLVELESMSIIHWPLDKWLDNVALAALSSKETLLATYDLARNVIERGIPGDFVECGVFGGAQCAVMARVLMDSSPLGDGRFRLDRRRVHLFDSFEGVPAPGPHDQEWIKAGHPEGQSVCTLESVKAHMQEWGIPDELLVYQPGWFSETMLWNTLCTPAGETVQQIALLRLDGDLYESTRVCMKHLYRLVSPGGWVIVDDFGLSGARKAFLETVGETGPGYFQRQP